MMIAWILFSILMTIMLFKCGQAYERSKPKITFKFTCLQPRCQFEMETNNMDNTMKLANAHASVHKE